MSKRYRLYRSHDETQLLTPGKIYEVDVEIRNTKIGLPAGYLWQDTTLNDQLQVIQLYRDLEEAQDPSYTILLPTLET